MTGCARRCAGRRDATANASCGDTGSRRSRAGLWCWLAVGLWKGPSRGWVRRGGSARPKGGGPTTAGGVGGVVSPLGGGKDLRVAGSVAAVRQGLREAARDRGGDDLRGDEQADAKRRLVRAGGWSLGYASRWRRRV